MNPRYALLVFAFATSAQAELAFYRGTIGDKIGVSIEVDPADSKATGSVSYDSSGDANISLDVTAGTAGGFPWKETLYSRETDKTEKTGTFTGKVNDGGQTVEGTWASPDGKKTLPYRLTRAARLLELKSSEAGARVIYPQLDDPRFAALNRWLADEAQADYAGNLDWVKESRRELKEAGASEESIAAVFLWRLARVESVNSQFVSLSYRHAEFQGGAHPNTIFSGVNYHVAPDGTPKKLGLWDVLLKSDANIKSLSNLLIAELKRQNASYIKDGTVKDFIKPLKTDGVAFVMLPAAIGFMFSPYEIGPYVEGDFRVVVPYEQLTKAIRPDGPLANATKTP